ncbi:MAG TPA: isoprenylcysteine carboxylmethyltransferase family protein [Verrucomicrobiae bacterium]|nr:isoprenylcysteine carboxylmethyltransferase family protein [Verrucomicrobiae bacterium]
MPFIYFVYVTFACWVGFVVYWVMSSIDVKETAEMQSPLQRVIVLGFMVVGFVLLGYVHLPAPLSNRILAPGYLVGILAIISSACGLALCIWARRTLGRNWSAQVTFKKGHELITAGPYAYVRHPIYTGFGLLFLGSALVVGTIGGFLGLLVIMIGFIYKYKAEERLMLTHFPEQYPGYKAKVKALIPYVF